MYTVDTSHYMYGSGSSTALRAVNSPCVGSPPWQPLVLLVTQLTSIWGERLIWGKAALRDKANRSERAEIVPWAQQEPLVQNVVVNNQDN